MTSQGQDGSTDTEPLTGHGGRRARSERQARKRAPLVPAFATFTPASPAASRAKRANRREGGLAERLLRAAVWRRGLRFRRHVAGLPGKPDLVFAGARLCVFCDGDFWHGRDWPQLHEQLLHRANPDYWIPKISRNMHRDVEQTRALEEAGWAVVRLWETDVLRDPEAAATSIQGIVRQRRDECRLGRHHAHSQGESSLS